MAVNMIKFNIFNYIQNTVTFFDRLKGFKTKNKLKIGWCGVFPPYQNGAAAVSYYFVRELLKRNDIEMGLIPINNKIEKKLFKKAIFCNLNNSSLNAVVFWCLGDKSEDYMKKTNAMKVSWQTIHYGLHIKSEIDQINEIRHSDLKIFMTEGTKKLYQKKADAAAYIPFGVDTGCFRPSRNNTFEVIFVSRMNYYKGIMPFLDTIPYVLKKCPDVIFRLYSPSDIFSPYLEEMKKSIKNIKKKYPSNFFYDFSWRPYDHIMEVYNSASIMVFPSNNEGFGVPIIEAMSCGIPCIVSDIPPMNEIVTKEVGFCLKQKNGSKYHGFAFPDPIEISEKIIDLKNNSKKLKIMGQKCRDHIQTNYELKDCVDKFIKLIKKEVKDRRTGTG